MRRMRSVAACILACVLGTGCSISTSGFPREPMVAIETGMHTASIWSIGVDRHERVLVSGSDDKTIRIWNLQSGQLLRTIRVPSALGNPGKIDAIAVSPDGRQIAAGGFSSLPGEAEMIYVFDLPSGALINRIGGLPNVVTDLMFSPDGRHLAAAVDGVRLYETDGFTEVARDEYGRNARGLDFATDGRLVAMSGDGFIRLYDSQFRLVTKVEAPSGSGPLMGAFSADGDEVAVGYANKIAVDILSAADLALLYSVDMDGATNGDLATVAWSADGRHLCAGGSYHHVTSGYPLRCWGERGRGVFKDIQFGATDTITALKALHDGGFAVASADPVVGVLDAPGMVRWMQRGEKADLRGQRGPNSMRVSENGDVISFGLAGWGERPARFSLRDGTLELNPAPDDRLRGARTEVPGVEIESWINSSQPIFNGQPLPLYPGELSRSLDIAPNGDRFVLGTEWYLRAFDRDGRQLWQTATSEVVWSCTITGDGQAVVAGLGDGTIRWYDMANGRELLAFFPHLDGERWVAWLPEGFFAASERGEELIGYHINRGADHAPDFVRPEQLFDRYYRPDLLVQRLEGNEAPIRVALADVGDVDALLQASRPPSIELTGPEVQHADHTRFVHEVVLGDEGSGIGKVVYRVNGVRIDQVDTRAEVQHRGNGRIVRSQPLDLKQGRNEIEARVFTADGKLASAPVIQLVEVDDPQLRPPALYGIAVGIDAYFDSALALRYASNDARTFRETMESLSAPLFTNVDMRLLTDQAATKDGIAEAFRDLASIVGPNDVFVLYLAGHGFAEKGRYHFIPQELRYSDHDTLLAGSVDEEDLLKLLDMIKAQKNLVIVDTCSAAALGAPQEFALLTRGIEEKTAIDRLMRASGRNFLYASSDRDLALEGYEGHGLYTYVLLEGLRGDADLKNGNGNRQTTITELSEYLDDRVPSLSQEVFGRTQLPMRSLSGQSFPVAVVR